MDPLAPLIAALHSEGRLRVWSLVITVFGDLVQHRGGEISTARLRLLLGRIGVEQGTLRTALSRLSGDGWVAGERSGRTSHYRLTPQGVARFAPATTRIYAPPRREPVLRWAAIVSLAENGASHVRICPADEAEDTGDCCIVGDLATVSARYRAHALSAEHRAALVALAADLAALRQPICNPLDAAAARVLLIHRWRRIILRYPEVAVDLMPGDSPLKDPRAGVAKAYAALSPATEAWLDGSMEGEGSMPLCAEETPLRFGSTRQA
ncbi:PaaX family transcriptional regulator C-terminal domain-containing protein [Sedimentitalea sp. JM2-8]|uniref:PaaX family transcriptional regulator C-terminal domain-containing protein n=1 Tax=Sedimentitalea xiamensis TaxID=3050037 RepID=A0ABT7FKK3_9RHOB|nr:PaaX family transcriptional regulator C-terminal domain-containing protein [Sedimentitalea xiamensis]MDK3075627.1 PaaX family transcriptional regulator C-terminal domain-containing protein [Sedimentitalea xiamensis]